MTAPPAARAARLLVSVAALAALGWSAPARACSICGCGDPFLAASDPAALSGRLRLEADTEYLRIDAGNDARTGATDHLTQWSLRLNAAYRPTDALSLTITLPLVSKTIRTVGGAPAEIASDLAGVGDVEVGARYTVWRTVSLGVGRVQSVALSAGTAVPTGRADARGPDGALIDPHGQLGTGGWGPFAGVHYGFEQGKWLAFASVSGRARTGASYFDGSGYRFGNALLWSVHVQHRPVRRVALDLGVDGRHAQADRARATDGTIEDAVANTGGTVVAAAPGVYVDAAGPLWLFVRGQIPFVKALRGEQDVLPSFTTGIQLELQ